MGDYDIVNVVTTADLGQKVDIVTLGLHEEFHHDEMSYGGRVAYHDCPGEQGKVSIFHSGKMISVGSKSIESSKRLLSITKDALVREGYIHDLELEPKVRNIVYLLNLGHSIRLESLVGISGASYEPEQFPGAILRVTEPAECTLTIFSSGKIILTGLKQAELVEDVYAFIFGLVSDM